VQTYSRRPPIHQSINNYWKRSSPSPNTSSSFSSSPTHRRSGPTKRAMARRIQENWNTATEGKETFLYMFKPQA